MGWDDSDDEFEVDLKKGAKADWEDEDEASDAEDGAGAGAAGGGGGDGVSARKRLQMKREAEKKKAEEEAAAKSAAALAAAEEDSVSRKMRERLLVEEADLELTKELMGTSSERKGGDVYSALPKTKKEFLDFAKAMADVCAKFSKTAFYVDFLKEFDRQAASTLSADDCKNLAKTYNALANEKVAEEKAAAGKKKKKAGARALVMERGDAYDSFGQGAGPGGGAYDDEVDFM